MQLEKESNLRVDTKHNFQKMQKHTIDSLLEFLKWRLLPEVLNHERYKFLHNIKNNYPFFLIYKVRRCHFHIIFIELLG